jgi:hypothetical protein
MISRRQIQPLCRMLGALAAVVIMGAPAEAAVTAMPGWNLQVEFFDTGISIPAGGDVGWLVADETITDVFTEGELIIAYCQYQYAAVKNPKSFMPFTVTYRMDGQVVDVEKVTKYEQQHATPLGAFLAPSAGNHLIECRLDVADANSSDNVKTRAITVKAKKPGIAGDLPAPAPEFLQPQPGQKFWQTAGSRVVLTASVPNEPFGTNNHDPGDHDFSNFFEYSKATIQTEQWHLEVVRIGSGPNSGAEAKVASYAGNLIGLQFAHAVDVALPVGRYAARAWLTQQVTAGLRVGPNSRVEFDVLAPATVQQPSPSAVARTPGSLPPVFDLPAKVAPVPAPQLSRQPSVARSKETSPRLVSAREEAPGRVSVVLLSQARTPGMGGGDVELLLGTEVVGRAQLAASPAGGEQHLALSVSLPPGTTMPAVLAIRVGGNRVGSVRLTMPVFRDPRLRMPR